MKYWEIEFKDNEISQKNAKILLLNEPSLSPFNNKPLYLNNKWIMWSNLKEEIVKKFNHPGIKMIKSTNIDYQIPFINNAKKNIIYKNLIIDSLFN